MKHAQFIARTVMVQKNNVEEACRLLNRILGKEEIFDQYRRTRFYEKPYQASTTQVKTELKVYKLKFRFQVRRRVNFEKCKAIYNEDMNRKIQLVLRKNRTEPFPGCS